MKIYDKKLSSLQDLRKERLRLKNRLKDPADNTGKEEDKESFISGLLSGITSGSVLTTVLNAAPTLIDLIKHRSSAQKIKEQKASTPSKKNKNVIAAVLTDVAASYIKWKLLELSYKGLKKALKSEKMQSFKHKTAAKIQKTFK